jgi:hypothetical protein
MTEKRVTQWQADGWANEPTWLLFAHLTSDDDVARDQTAKMANHALTAGGEVEAKFKLPAGRGVNRSQVLLCAFARWLDKTYGMKAPLYDRVEGWLQLAALAVGSAVDYFQLADRLLRKYVVEYVPGEAVLPEDVDPGEDEDAG